MENLYRYHTVGADDLTNFSHRNLNSIEFLQTFTAQGNVLANSKFLPMVYGALYILDASVPHCTAPDCPQKYERNLICFDRNDFISIIQIADCEDIYKELFETGSMCIKLPKDKIKMADEIFKEIYFESKSKLLISSALIKFSLLLNDKNSVVSPKDSGLISLAVDYIENNLSSDLSTAAIALNLNVSKYYLCHLFHKKTGMRLTDYVKEKRIKEASKLLKEGKFTVSEISEKVGYLSTAYFCKTFKEIYGITPTEFKNLK